MSEQKEFLNVEELATYLNCSAGLVHKLKKQGKIPFIKVGYSIRFEKSEVLKCLKEKTDDSYIE